MERKLSAPQSSSDVAEEMKQSKFKNNIASFVQCFLFLS
jgi:hypothetical protein